MGGVRIEITQKGGMQMIQDGNRVIKGQTYHTEIWLCWLDRMYVMMNC